MTVFLHNRLHWYCRNSQIHKHENIDTKINSKHKQTPVKRKTQHKNQIKKDPVHV